MIRTGWVALVAILLTAFYALVALLSSPVPGWRACRCGRWARDWATIILRAAGVTVTATGLERVAAGRSQIVVCNHQSWFDVLALFAAFPPTVSFVAKEELRSIPVFGQALQWCGHIFIDRRNRGSAIQSLRRVARQLREQARHVVVFAEGTRSVSGELQPFKKGAFILAVETQVPVLPVAVAGSLAVMAKHSYTIRAGAIEVRVGEPIAVEGLTVADRGALRDRSRNAVGRLLDGGPASAGSEQGAAARHPPAGQNRHHPLTHDQENPCPP